MAEIQKSQTTNFQGFGAFLLIVWIIMAAIVVNPVLKFIANLILFIAILLLTEYPQKIMKVTLNEMGKIQPNDPEAKG